MSDFTPVGHCGKQTDLCLPNICDDLCVGCPINGWEVEENE